MPRKWLYITVGAVFLLAIILAAAACGGSDTGTTATTAAAGESTTTAAPETTTTEPTTTTTEATTTTTAAADVGTRENPIPLGQEAQIGDWKVKVTGATPNANQAIADANQFNDPPAAGQQYVLVEVAGTYTGQTSGTFWADISYKYVGSGGNTYDQGFAVAPNPISDAGEVFPDASVSGNLVFAVDSDQVSGGTLALEESFSFDETRLFFAVE